MSKWILKKTLNESLKKNLIIEDTNALHLRVIPLKDYGGGFSNFSSGKNYKISENEVVKLVGKKEDFTEYLVSYDETPKKSYRWIGESIGKLIPGQIYRESYLKNQDVTVPVDTGMGTIFLEVHDEVYLIRGTNKGFHKYLRIIHEGQVEKVVEETQEPEVVDKRTKVVTEFIREFRLTGATGQEGSSGKDGLQGEVGPAGVTGETGVGIKDIDQIDRENVLIHLSNNEVHELKLPSGLTGSQGKMGPVGKTGKTGKVGSKGDKGERGDQGLEGERGDKGDRGSRGVQGPIGPIGPEGKQGSRGERGQDGEPGVAGPQGAQGPAGKRGPKGPKGEKGRDGSNGPAGESPRVKAKYPLVYEEDRGLFTLDKKFFEKLLSGGQVNQQLINKFVNSTYAGGGGGVGIVRGESGNIVNRSASDLVFFGNGVTLARDGHRVKIEITSGIGHGGGSSETGTPYTLTMLSGGASPSFQTYSDGSFFFNPDNNTIGLDRDGTDGKSLRYDFGTAETNSSGLGRIQFRIGSDDSADLRFIDFKNGDYDPSNQRFIATVVSTSNNITSGLNGKTVNIEVVPQPAIQGASQHFRFPDGTTTESIVKTLDGTTGDVVLSELKYKKMYPGNSSDVSSGTYATGDFHLNTSTGKLYSRLDGFWVEV